MAQAVHNRRVLDLPVDLLADVLQHVERPDRLRCCALVSKNWRQAANMTISTVDLTADTQQGFDNLSAWFNSNLYTSRLQSIQVYKTTAHAGDVARPVLRVPFSALKQLTSLQLLHCQVQTVSPAADVTNSSAATMAAGPTAPTVPGLMSLGALTALRRLELVKASLDLSELSSCTGLQRMQVCEADYRAGQARGSMLSQLVAALPQLTQLTHLDFWHFASMLDREETQLLLKIWASLSSLQQLKELQLSIRPSFELAELQCICNIPTSLSSLHLHSPPSWNFITMPLLQQMTTQLQCLRLVRPEGLNPAALSGFTQLTCFCLTTYPVRGTEVVADLLSAVQQMEQLRHLDLAHSLKDKAPLNESYAALTASSQLTSLDITGCSIPADACPYIFPDGYALDALISIATYPALLYSVRFFERLATCCQSLQQLVIVGDGQHLPGIPLQGLSALQGLSTLTTLVMVGMEFSDQELKAIAAFCQLKQLTLCASHHSRRSVTPAAVMQLTQLTGLTKLKVSVRMDKRSFEETLVAADDVPGVYLQLQQAIAKHK